MDALGGGSNSFIVSLKNGGGIRAQIGSVSSAGGAADKLPPIANPKVGKAAGAVSQLDVENSLRFDNKLMAFDTNAQGLKALLEHAVAVWPNQGRFPQIGGVSFSWDPDLPANSRVTDIALIDEAGGVTLRLYDNGVLQVGLPPTITVVTLNFIANNGDGYPAKSVGENFRFLLDNGSLSAPLMKHSTSRLQRWCPPMRWGNNRHFAAICQSSTQRPQGRLMKPTPAWLWICESRTSTSVTIGFG